MFESIMKFFKRAKKSEKEDSKNTAKERLHLVLAQDRANISADFLELMKQEILEVIKKYIDIDEKEIDVRLTNKEGEDGSVGAPALYANIPIITIKNEARKLEGDVASRGANNNEAQTEVNNNEQVNENEQDTENTSLENEYKENENEDNNLEDIQPEISIEESIAQNEILTDELLAQQTDEGQIESNLSETNNDNVNEVEDEKKNS